MRLQDFGSFECVHEDPKHVDILDKTHHDNHDDIHVDDALGSPHNGVVSSGKSDNHMVVKVADKHGNLDSLDYSFLILTTRYTMHSWEREMLAYTKWAFKMGVLLTKNAAEDIPTTAFFIYYSYLLNPILDWVIC
jgi:hypothetical protein